MRCSTLLKSRTAYFFVPFTDEIFASGFEEVAVEVAQFEDVVIAIFWGQSVGIAWIADEAVLSEHVCEFLHFFQQGLVRFSCQELVALF